MSSAVKDFETSLKTLAGDIGVLFDDFLKLQQSKRLKHDAEIARDHLKGTLKTLMDLTMNICEAWGEREGRVVALELELKKYKGRLAEPENKKEGGGK